MAKSAVRFRKVFVGGLNPLTTEDGLKGHFGQFGRIDDVVVIRERGEHRKWVEHKWKLSFHFINCDMRASAVQVPRLRLRDLLRGVLGGRVPGRQAAPVGREAGGDQEGHVQGRARGTCRREDRVKGQREWLLQSFVVADLFVVYAVCSYCSLCSCCCCCY